jgi:hypothetical protein
MDHTSKMTTNMVFMKMIFIRNMMQGFSLEWAVEPVGAFLDRGHFQAKAEGFQEVQADSREDQAVASQVDLEDLEDQEEAGRRPLHLHHTRLKNRLQRLL